MNYAHYEIVKKLGSGMMGDVYQARDPYLDKIIALKVLRMDRLIMKNLSKKPDDRFQTGESIKEALTACLETIKSKEAPASVSSKRLWKRIGVLGIILLVAVFLMVFTPRMIPEDFLKTGKIVKPSEDVMPQEKPKPVFPQQQSILNVKSEPAGARVFVNDRVKGNTPLGIKLEVGEYLIRLSLPGHDDWEAPVELDEADEIPLFVRLIPVD